MVLNDRGEILTGDYRADQMEGKLKYKKTLSEKEKDKTFMQMSTGHDQFIAVNKSSSALEVLKTKQQRTSDQFKSMRKTLSK